MTEQTRTYSARQHRRNVARLVYWANTGAAWYDLAHLAGYEIDHANPRGDAVEERRLVFDGRVVALMHRLQDEWVGFAFVAEARSPRWREALWRLTHPRTPRRRRPGVTPLRVPSTLS